MCLTLQDVDETLTRLHSCNSLCQGFAQIESRVHLKRVAVIHQRLKLIIHLFSRHWHDRWGGCGPCHTPFSCPFAHGLVCDSEAEPGSGLLSSFVRLRSQIKGRRVSVFLLLIPRFFSEIVKMNVRSLFQQTIAEKQQGEQRTAVVRLGMEHEVPT